MLVTNVAYAASGKQICATCPVVYSRGSRRRALFHLSTTTKMSSAPKANTINGVFMLTKGKNVIRQMK